MKKEVVINGVECGADVEVADTGDWLMADSRDQFIVQRDVCV